MKSMKTIVFIIWAISLVLLNCTHTDFGGFENNTDIGKIYLQGLVQFDSETKQYRITGSGENIWGTEDAFHFLWREFSGDLKLSSNIAWLGTDAHEHRKAGLRIRQSLAPDAVYVNAVVHGNGLISLQYRDRKGCTTHEFQTPVKTPASIRLERDGDLFTLSVAKINGVFQPAGVMTITFTNPVYAGLTVCAHDSTTQETAIFSQIRLENPGVIPDSLRVLESTLEIVEVATGERQIIHRVKEHIEAPNWAPNGKTLVYNSRGILYSIPVTGGTPNLIHSGIADQCNNDHGFSPDGKWIALSHNTSDKGSLIYIIPSTGGDPRLITKQGPSYWHGWSPNGKTLAYCAQRNGEYDIYTIHVKGGQEKRLTTTAGLDDGPDYSPDGKYIYINSERTGLMKIWRMRANGEQQEQSHV